MNKEKQIYGLYWVKKNNEPVVYLPNIVTKQMESYYLQAAIQGINNLSAGFKIGCCDSTSFDRTMTKQNIINYDTLMPPVSVAQNTTDWGAISDSGVGQSIATVEKSIIAQGDVSFSRMYMEDSSDNLLSISSPALVPFSLKKDDVFSFGYTITLR